MYLILKFCPDVPVEMTVYPFFHPNRPRFFNMATLYSSLHSLIIDQIEAAFPTIKPNSFLNSIEMADQSYVRWEANGGIDLSLPSFKLTNRQMYWVCFVHVTSVKVYHKTSDKLLKSAEFFFKELNLFLKNSKGFTEAFQCDDITEDEKKNAKN